MYKLITIIYKYIGCTETIHQIFLLRQTLRLLKRFHPNNSISGNGHLYTETADGKKGYARIKQKTSPLNLVIGTPCDNFYFFFECYRTKLTNNTVLAFTHPDIVCKASFLFVFVKIHSIK